MAAVCVHCGSSIPRPQLPRCPACGKEWRATGPADVWLEVVDGANARRSVPLGAAPLTIGRAPTNDLVLGSRFVSAQHARIDATADGHAITDLGSMNGLLIDGARLPANQPRRLGDGTTIRIGDAATGSFVTLIYRSPRAAAQASTQLRIALAPDGATSIGRRDAAIVLNNPQVSRRHAVIEGSGGRHRLRDAGSTNGTFVNGQRITSHELVNGDIIAIGTFRLVYRGTALEEYDQRGALRIEARRLKTVVATAQGPRTIMHDVSLAIEPREFVAIVGGSGTGKSTLLKALAGFTPATAGEVRVNEDDFYANLDVYRSVIGYVPQDDILHRGLNVVDALGYVAELRLPPDTSPGDRRQRVERVLDDVDMDQHQTTVIDRLSGGQRKRVSIAAELLADPALFFLDEPTSGLDPGLEKRMMYTLRRLADGGRTIMLVTHATANIVQCDLVAFMAGGRMVYFGPPRDATTFFQVDDHEFAEIYTKLDGRATPDDRAGWQVVQQDLPDELAAHRREFGDAAVPSLAELWERRFRASHWYDTYVTERLSGREGAGSRRAAQPTGRPRTSLVGQTLVLTRRYAKLMLNDRRNLLLLGVQAPVIGALVALVARRDSFVGENATAAEARKILFVFATVAVWFGVLNAAREIAKELPIVRRERLAGLRVVPYLVSKVSVALVLLALQAFTLLGIAALKITLPTAGVLLPAPLELYLTTFITALAGFALGLAISASSTAPDRANALVPLALVPQILFAGVIFSLGDPVSFERILSWVTASRWAMDAYGATVHVNDLPWADGMLPLPNPPAEYTATVGHVLSRWAVLLGYAAICLGYAARQLRRL
jgi:ABC-type multidrug transport system ATPase subunit/ABC-type multidrug transport system permease subunit